ncbi:MAG: hypothetical protein A2622_00690 [Bdellovibrionales bacterium RIFCSPHIGHO2_01_FULL_40_29]|nr:MAG: hypothetical protein A2622_00690 [Bdellovibrionales bacterium RIFCSPHIGHO2_01_FULL_40_29]OFZ32636.1 MAG: hypothetical protein A3D17_05290 [Bdellovibrionales bacterium RIFCSPHIGHO2_02_FULL_40_15]
MVVNKAFQKIWKLIAFVVVIYIAIELVLFIQHSDMRTSHKGRSKILFALQDFYKFCERFPTTEEGLIILKIGTECYSSKIIDSSDSFQNGYGNKFVYESDGKTFKLKSVGRFRDRITTESYFDNAQFQRQED